jgi:hypothetical protein
MYKLKFDKNELYEVESIVHQASKHPYNADIDDMEAFLSMREKLSGYMELTEDEISQIYSIMRQAFKHPSESDICEWDFFYSAYHTIKEEYK